MTVQDINDSIDRGIEGTNDRLNRSNEIRHRHKDNYMQERLEKFDKLCLVPEEREQISYLNEAELAQFKESRKYAAKSAFNAVKAAVGGPIGASFGVIGAADNSQKWNQSEEKLDEISRKRDEIRAKAQERYEKATGLNVNVQIEKQEEELNYGR